MEKKEEEFLIMPNCDKLLEDLKIATTEKNSKSVDNFMESRPYYIKTLPETKLKSPKGKYEISIEQFVNSLRHDRVGKDYKFDFRKQILLNTDDAKDEIIAKKCYESYAQGSGSEFKWHYSKRYDKWYPPKMAAIKSSSMLCFNAFSHVDKDHSIEINGVVYNKVFFEAKLPTLTISRNHPANMDAVLISKDCETILFIESKFTETFGSRHSYNQIVAAKNPSLSKNYYSKESYFGDSGEKWTAFLENYIKKQLVENDIKTLLPMSGSHLDLKQDICHCIGIYNFAKRLEIKDDECNDMYKEWLFKDTDSDLSKAELDRIFNHRFSKYIFMNLEYEPDKDKYPKLHECFEDAKYFGGIFGETIKKEIFGDIPFEYSFYSYKDFANDCLPVIKHVGNKCVPETKHKELFMKKYLLK